MLDIVEHPVAFNPDKGLYEAAVSHHWPIVVERKNVVYELKPDKDGYRLAAESDHA